ncbi:uncharacterized protein LOC135394332 [Ornithodoros turicata]|uniref:uncharacterized protein LOC135394332 n=1 Tax=Ornithodoros turicata TaxID=34597 RepID=UPI0031388537
MKMFDHNYLVSTALTVSQPPGNNPESQLLENARPPVPQRVSADWPTTFSIPFHRANSGFLSDLEQKKRPKKKHLLEFVRLVCSDIHNICARTGRAALAEVARRIVEAHPVSLSDTLGGAVVGSGYDSLRAKLENRLDNLNRGSAEAVPVARASHRKRVASDKCGCIEWNCSPPAGETAETQEDKRAELEEMFAIENASLSRAIDMMQQTYFLQREHINQGLSVSQVQDKWPWLLTTECLLNHFKRLTGIDCKERFSNAMSLKVKAVLQFLTTSQNEEVQKIMQSVSQAFHESQTHYGDPVGMLLGTIASWNEDSSYLIVELGTDVLIQDAPLPLTAVIVCAGSPYTCRTFMVAADQQIVMTAISDFTNALCALMALYFVFNIAYPRQAEATLDFLQRCFLQINPERGTKAKSKRRGPGVVTQKALSFVEKIKQYEATSWVFC